jgi:hypothetical protein
MGKRKMRQRKPKLAAAPKSWVKGLLGRLSTRSVGVPVGQPGQFCHCQGGSLGSEQKHIS